MHQEDQKEKRKKVLKRKPKKNGPDEKKSKFEDVHQNSSSSFDKSQNFVNFGRENSSKMYNTKYIEKLNKFAKRGQKCLIVLFMLIEIISMDIRLFYLIILFVVTKMFLD